MQSGESGMAEKKSVEKELFGNIDLEVTKKKKFRINGDADKVLELNISDMNIVTRLKTILPKLQDLQKEANEKIDAVAITPDSDDDLEAITGLADALVDIDTKMRNLIDELFDSNVSELCAPDGSMYDPFAGEFRYEHIISVIGDLYATNISEEFDKMSKRISKRTAKYTKKK